MIATELDPYLLPEYQYTTWEINQEKFSRLLETTRVDGVPLVRQIHFESLLSSRGEKLIPAFMPTNNDVGCVDEGVEKRLRIAGSGILFPLKAAAALLQTLGAEQVTSHESCGAAAAAANAVGCDDPNQFAIEYAKQVAELAGIPYGGHVPQDRMRRPRLFHDAPVAYIDTTNSFNPLALPGLFPNGFVVSAGVNKAQQHLVDSQIEAIVGIALNHGIGSNRLSETPFRLVHIRRPDEVYVNTANLEAIARRSNGLVVVDSFRAPRIPARDYIR